MMNGGNPDSRTRIVGDAIQQCECVKPGDKVRDGVIAIPEALSAPAKRRT